jgi:hypothetical protein
MIDTLPQVETRASPPRTNEDSNRAGTPFGFLAACIVLAIAAIFLGVKLHTRSSELGDVKAQLALSSSSETQARAALAAASEQTAVLQTQVSRDQAQQASLQSQVGAAMAQAAGLQSQASRDQVLRTDLQAQLAGAKAQAADARARLATAQGQREDLQSQLAGARAQAADAQAKLAAAQSDLAKLHPLIVEARHMPLLASFEKSFWDQRFTLHVSNPGTQPMNVRITASGPEKTRYQAAVIEGGATVNIERLPPGEKVVISSDGFDPLSLTAQ